MGFFYCSNLWSSDSSILEATNSAVTSNPKFFMEVMKNIHEIILYNSLKEVLI